jgi:hypothetical protein
VARDQPVKAIRASLAGFTQVSPKAAVSPHALAPTA